MDLSGYFRFSLIAILSLSAIFNSFFVAFTVNNKVDTSLCTILMRSQGVIDLLLTAANIIVMQLYAYIPELSQSMPDLLWNLYCKLYRSQVFYWSLVSMSVYNLLCISIERFVCICCPFWYRLNKRKLKALLIAVIAVSPFILEAPVCLAGINFVYQAAVNGTKKSCNIAIDSNLHKIVSFAYVVLFWIAPFLVIVIIYTCIVRRIRRSANIQEAPAGGSRTDTRISAATKKLTLTTGVTAAAFVLLFAMDSICFIIVSVATNIVLPAYLADIDSFLVSMNGAVNPLICLIFMAEFRRFLLCQRCRQFSNARQTGTEH